jgi:hypothetical protein
MTRGSGEPWSADGDELARFTVAYEAGMPERELLRLFPGKTVGQFRGKAINLQLHRPPKIGAYVLPLNNPALAEDRTLFPGRVREPAEAPVLLVTGRDQRKLGGRVTKGAWAGFPIYSLTLEERATCPADCQHIRSCMGNSMQFAWRHRAGPELEHRISTELATLQRRHRGGFAVRLHILGDFYSVAYVSRWAEWLEKFPALHVWGYTAWPASSSIGAAVLGLAAARWDRFAIRLSSTEPGPDRAITLWEMPDFSALSKIIVCPAELGQTKGCGTCALCWSPAARDQTIAFLAHGGKGRVAGAHKSARKGTNLSVEALRAAVEFHGSQRKAAAVLHISLGKLQRALRREPRP